ncbi:cysteine hydrolase [Candidatus Woesearchaeota archaeon]|nr:cysteine hydrolase [Candidatus Woesearchaeota archaeon]
MTEKKLLPGRLEEALDMCLFQEEIPAVLLIDMQEGYLPFLKHSQQKEFKQVVQRQVEILQYAKKITLPIFLAKQYLIEGPMGNTLSQLKEILSGYENAVEFAKQSRSAFAETMLEPQLRLRGVTSLLVMGMTTNDCPLATARHARDLGFKVISAPTVLFGSYPIDHFYYQECFFYDDKSRNKT